MEALPKPVQKKAVPGDGKELNGGPYHNQVNNQIMDEERNTLYSSPLRAHV